jgi:uncharacterized protein YceK
VRRHLPAPILALLLSGCGTYINLPLQSVPFQDHAIVYGGVRVDLAKFLPMFPLGTLLALIDLPLSLAFDTLTLPLTVPSSLLYGWDPGSRPGDGSPKPAVEGED